MEDLNPDGTTATYPAPLRAYFCCIEPKVSMHNKAWAEYYMNVAKEGVIAFHPLYRHITHHVKRAPSTGKQSWALGPRPQIWLLIVLYSQIVIFIPGHRA